MIKNWLIFTGTAAALFFFSAFHQFSSSTWLVFLLFSSLPLLSALISLPLMISGAFGGIEIFFERKIFLGDPLFINICSHGKGVRFFPRIGLTVVADNGFARVKKRVRIKTGGRLSEKYTAPVYHFGSHCGLCDIRVKSCRVYDFLGMFFIPVNKTAPSELMILPRSQVRAGLPDLDDEPVLGFKPKPGGGFSDYYELRGYRAGDSLKNIHWKISSKYDDLIVREPSSPVVKPLVIRLDDCSDPTLNDGMLAKFIYAAESIIERGKIFYCADRGGGYTKIESNDDLGSFLRLFFRGGRGRDTVSASYANVFLIHPDGEEVLG